MTSFDTLAFPQVKTCGLTVPEEAAACASMGAAAIGLVFHPPSPRCVDLAQGRRIQAALPDQVPAVGVFVNPDWEFICRAVETCRLGGIQLHGNEPPDLVDRLKRTFAIPVIKVLFASRAPMMTEARHYSADGYLVEAGKGILPGGNAEVWDWGAAREFASGHRTLLAGGLAADNVIQAVTACLPDAVDVSSGLESAPGRKDMQKVERFLSAVAGTAGLYKTAHKAIQSIFNASRREK